MLSRWKNGRFFWLVFGQMQCVYLFKLQHYRIFLHEMQIKFPTKICHDFIVFVRVDWKIHSVFFSVLVNNNSIESFSKRCLNLEIHHQHHHLYHNEMNSIFYCLCHRMKPPFEKLTGARSFFFGCNFVEWCTLNIKDMLNKCRRLVFQNEHNAHYSLSWHAILLYANSTINKNQTLTRLPIQFDWNGRCLCVCMSPNTRSLWRQPHQQNIALTRALACWNWYAIDVYVNAHC